MSYIPQLSRRIVIRVLRISVFAGCFGVFVVIGNLPIFSISPAGAFLLIPVLLFVYPAYFIFSGFCLIKSDGKVQIDWLVGHLVYCGLALFVNAYAAAGFNIQSETKIRELRALPVRGKIKISSLFSMKDLDVPYFIARCGFERVAEVPGEMYEKVAPTCEGFKRYGQPHFLGEAGCYGVSAQAEDSSYVQIETEIKGYGTETIDASIYFVENGTKREVMSRHAELYTPNDLSWVLPIPLMIVTGDKFSNKILNKRRDFIDAFRPRSLFDSYISCVPHT